MKANIILCFDRERATSNAIADLWSKNPPICVNNALRTRQTLFHKQMLAHFSYRSL